MNTELAIFKDAVKATLAKNLVLARTANGITQAELAIVASVSRATIAQLEAGEGDPRLSTIIDLATALDISPLLLLMGEDEIKAIASVRIHDTLVSDIEIEQMRRMLASGLPKQRLQAGMMGALAATSVGLSGVGAAIGTGIIPGIGTAVGAAVGAYLLTKRFGREPKK